MNYATNERLTLLNHRPPLQTILREKEGWLLVLLWLAYCFRPVFLSYTFFFRDLAYIFFPQVQLWANLLKSGQLPLWDPYHHGGHPFLADVANGTFYPTNLLYLLLPTLKAFNLVIVFHFIGCSCAAYICARIVGLPRLSSLVSGMVYGACGCMLSLGDQYNRFLAMPYIPLLIACWHLFLIERRPRWFVAASVAGAIQVLPGAPEVNVMTICALVGWTIAAPSERAMRKNVTMCALLIISILGIAACQILPTLEAITQSSRGAGLTYGEFTQWSLSLRRLPEFVIPEFRGYTDTLPYNVYFWGGDLEDKGYPYFLNLYVGAIAVALALIGGTGRHGQARGLTWRVRLFLLALWLGSIVLAFGRELPFFEWAYYHFPLLKLFRYPIKFLLIGLFPMALLAGHGFSVLFERDRKGEISSHAPQLFWVLWGMAGTLFVVSALFRISPSFAAAVQQLCFTRANDVIYQGLMDSLILVTVCWLLFVIAASHVRLRQRASWQPWIAAAIIILDLFMAGKRVNPVASESFFTEQPPIVDIVRKQIGDGRLYRTEDPLAQMFHIPEDHPFHVAPDHIMWVYRWQFDVLRMYAGAFYHIPVIFHTDYNLLAQRRIVKMKEVLETLPWERRLPLLSASGVSLILSAQTIHAPGIQHVATVPNFGDTPVHVYELTNAVPRARMVPMWKMAASDDEALSWMLKSDYDPRQHVVLQRPESGLLAFPWSRTVQNTDAAKKEPQPCSQPFNASVAIIENKNNSMSYRASSNCDGYLVFSEPYYPGWHVKIDGKPQPLLRANYAFSAVLLDAGTHDVVRYYLPGTFLIGIVISALTLGILGVIVLQKSIVKK